MAYAYGDMRQPHQPFWAIPLLGVARLIAGTSWATSSSSSRLRRLVGAALLL